MKHQLPQLLVLNGPNLNLLGSREPAIYGSQTFETYLQQLRNLLAQQAQLHYCQSNHEGELIDQLHQAHHHHMAGVVLNAGGYTHTSVALADAVAAISVPVVEVHISNTAAREAFRQHSYLSAVVRGTITGLGLDGYRLAVLHLLHHLSTPTHLKG